ncbi:hypothetical protein PG991_015322 [Apiospora marii]|uniref:Uncharacterized protein n=1 Tax=Apiospora marii TaxID=335849 RepID=A0ABR1R221_9PEZI
MIYRSTCVRLAATARQRWSPLLQPVLRQPRAAFWGLRVAYWPTRGIRYTADTNLPYDEPDIPVQQAAQASIGSSKLSSDRASLSAAADLKHIEVKAWKNDGKHALDVLDRLCLEPHDDQVIPKAITCLQAYKHSIEHLSVEDAKVVLANDEAGNRVVHWFETEAINQQIKRNHPENGTLLQLISDILTGASRLKKMESWILAPNKLFKELSDKDSLRSVNLWRSMLYTAILQSLLWWHPQGAKDDALDYFSNTCEHIVTYWPVYRINYGYPRVAIQQMMANPELLCIDSRCFDRCLATLERMGLQVKTHNSVHHFLTLAHIRMLHPFHPDPDPFLSFVRDVDADLLHSARFYARRGRGGRKDKTQALYYSSVRICGHLLRCTGRASDPIWLDHAFDRLFGRNSGWLGAKDPLSEKDRNRWYYQWMEKHFPDGYKVGKMKTELE